MSAARAHLLLALLLTCAVLTGGSSARADVVRFGLFVGSNLGADHEQPLRFAGTDAQRMQEVLVELGGFSPIDALVLREPNADVMRGALIALNDRVRAAAARPDTQVMLFVYYSGHADAKALHLGSTRLALLELEQLVRGSAAHFRALLIDACGSGALTRGKGGVPAAPRRHPSPERAARSLLPAWPRARSHPGRHARRARRRDEARRRVPARARRVRAPRAQGR